jgi:hypothetical protein
MNEDTVSLTDLEEEVRALAFLNCHAVEILRDLCNAILSDAVKHPEVWLNDGLRENILQSVHNVVKTASREVEQ